MNENPHAGPPRANESSDKIFELPYTVVEADIDAMNHVNNLEYIRWTLRAAHTHARSLGWSAERFGEIGAGFIVRSHSIKYRLSAILGDEVTIQTWVKEMNKFSSIRKYLIIRNHDGKRLAEAETKWVFVDFETQRPQAIPIKIRQAFGQ